MLLPTFQSSFLQITLTEITVNVKVFSDKMIIEGFKNK